MPPETIRPQILSTGLAHRAEVRKALAGFDGARRRSARLFYGFDLVDYALALLDHVDTQEALLASAPDLALPSLDLASARAQTGVLERKVQRAAANARAQGKAHARLIKRLTQKVKDFEILLAAVQMDDPDAVVDLRRRAIELGLPSEVFGRRPRLRAMISGASCYVDRTPGELFVHDWGEAASGVLYPNGGDFQPHDRVCITATTAAACACGLFTFQRLP